MPELTAETLREWQRDPLAFAAALTIRRPDGTLGPPQFSERQASWLRALAEREDGRPRYKTVGVVAPKRSGKTLVEAVALVWKSLAPDRLSIALANSRESAQSLGFAEASKLVERGPLAHDATIQRGRILFSWGAEIRAVACTPGAVTGLTVTGLLASDEAWAAEDEEPLNLLSSQTEGAEAQTLLVSQASGLESIVYRTFEAGEAGTPGLWFDYVTPEEIRAGLILNPYLTDAYLRQRRALLPAPVFEHYHENAWGAAGGTYMDADTIASCRFPYTFPATPEEAHEFCIHWGGGHLLCMAGGLDRAQPYSKGDDSVWCAVAALPGDAGPVLWVVALDVMPTGSEAEVLASVGRTWSIWGPTPSIFEAYQAADLAHKCGADLRHASGPAQSSLFGYVHRLATAGRLRFPSGPEGDLLAHQLTQFRVDTSTAIPTFSGGKGKGVDDTCYALGWACEKAREQCDAGEDDDDEEGEVVTMLDLLPGFAPEALGAARL